MDKVIKTALISALSLSVFLFAQAQTESLRGESFSYPIAELGNCASKSECKTFCAQEGNFDVCLDFAERHNLLPKKVIARREVLKDVLKSQGPGGCDSREACEAYCAQDSHQEECLAFAEKHGIIPKEELEQAKKFLPLMKKGETPGGCKSKEACEAYCHNPDNMEVCLEFADRHGLGPKEELEQAKKFLPLMREGKTPGACRSKEQCEAYCHQESNFEECIEFGLKIGAMNKVEAERARKTGGKGPGGCKGQNECELFCNNPQNQQACFDFAQEHGFVKEEELRHMKEGMNRMRAGLENAPEEVKDCLMETVDPEILEKTENGSFMPNPELGEKIRACFEKFRPAIEDQIQRQFQASPGVEECLKQTVGKEVLEKVKNGEAPPSMELGEKMRSCFEQFGRSPGSEVVGSGQEENHGFDPARFNAPEFVKQCVAAKLGGEKSFSEEQMRPIIEECFRVEREQTQQKQDQNQSFPSEILNEPVNQQSKYQQYQPSPDGEYPKQDFGIAPPPVYDQTIMENCKKQILGDPPQFVEGAREKIEICVRAASGQVQGVSTSRLPRFIRWILGR